MYSFKRYKKIYKDATFKDYLWRHVLYTPRKWCRIPYCTYMCIKYPFLYPRHRLTGFHYNNWKVIDLVGKFAKKYSCVRFSKGERLSGLEIGSFESLYPYYVECPSDKMIKGWVNWWSKPLYKLFKFYHNYILQFFHC